MGCCDKNKFVLQILKEKNWRNLKNFPSQILALEYIKKTFKLPGKWDLRILKDEKIVNIFVVEVNEKGNQKIS